ncbi:CdaR family protein [Fretibacterium sp. OH1220_COT-178]|uniref:CdaR family protein n=1 Tax=Fretibacterium sp. OH1220_COT-178 TaxID=2491047 RepID=UPI000F5E50E0|nr:CdaR family protein [Fretibacterium sp. OH1220_COT-178]RRD64862.1 hypothetical protein EII26_05665 [Fretibacterium sp. OH1220_COT-178]
MISSKNFDEILTSPWSLWAISVTAALLMWFYVMESDESGYVTRRFSCPLEYESLDAQATLRNKVSEVDVEIRGLEEVLARFDYDSVSCVVDLRNLSPGKKYTQDVRVNLPPNVSLVSCTPSQVVVDLLRQVVRLMPVEVVLPQDIPDGQYLEGVEIVPKEIAIRGGEKDISKIGAIQIQPTVQELQSGKELLLPVKLSQSEPFDEEVALEPSQVRMRASLVRGLPKKKVPVNLRLSGKPSSDYELKAVVTDPSEVYLEGPASRLSQISSVETETVDISWLSADQMLVVPLKAPNVKGVSILNVKSVRLSVHLEPAKATTQFSNIPVAIRAGSGESEWAAAPSVVVVTVEGLPSRIADIRPEDVGLQAYVDLSNIFVDSAALPVRVEIASEDLKVVKIEPPTVTVSTAEGSVGR